MTPQALIRQETCTLVNPRSPRLIAEAGWMVLIHRKPPAQRLQDNRYHMHTWKPEPKGPGWVPFRQLLEQQTWRPKSHPGLRRSELPEPQTEIRSTSPQKRMR